MQVEEEFEKGGYDGHRVERLSEQRPVVLVPPRSLQHQLAFPAHVKVGEQPAQEGDDEQAQRDEVVTGERESEWKWEREGERARVTEGE